MIQITASAGWPDRSGAPSRAAGQGRGVASGPHKWRDLMEPVTRARAALGLNATDLSVLRAILSFLPVDQLDTGRAEAHVCFAGNLAIAERIGTSGDSTVNRALRRLEAAGLVLRRPSANRKRFALRGRGGAILHAFGIDLAPLIAQAARLQSLARDADRAEDALLALRAQCCALLAEARARIGAAPEGSTAGERDLLEAAHRTLRRKPREEALAALHAALAEVVALRGREDACPSRNVSDTDRQNERHIEHEEEYADVTENEISEAFPTIMAYLGKDVDIRSTTDILVASLGDTMSAWQDCKRRLGFGLAFLLAGFVLEHRERIRNPGAYLRTLCRRIAAGVLRPRALLERLPAGEERALPRKRPGAKPGRPRIFLASLAGPEAEPC